MAITVFPAPSAGGGGGATYTNQVINQNTTVSVPNGLYNIQRFSWPNSNTIWVDNDDIQDTTTIRTKTVTDGTLNYTLNTQWPTSTNSWATTPFTKMKFLNDKLLAIRNSTSLQLGTSTDGLTWTSVAGFASTRRTFGIDSDANTYVIVGESGTLFSSTDAVTWTVRTSQFGTSSIEGIVYANSQFVAAGAAGKVSTSTDGITWVSRTTAYLTRIDAIAYGAGLYVVTQSNGTIQTSTDAITWTSRYMGFSIQADNLIFANEVFVAGGNSNNLLATSTDGITWVSRTLTNYINQGTQIEDLAYHNGLYLAVGGSGMLHSSTDAITWTTGKSVNYAALGADTISYVYDKYLVGLENGSIRVSTDLQFFEAPSAVQLQYFGPIVEVN
jgi:hypothetical protein